MRAILNLNMGVPDNFKCGDCEKCPLSVEKYFTNQCCVRKEVTCKLGMPKELCPLELEEIDKKENAKKEALIKSIFESYERFAKEYQERN